jgi:DNA-binding CsgD family transcriptional regulator
MPPHQLAVELRGRKQERGVLDALIASVRTGRSETLVLRGEAGVGKSALLDHMVASATDFRLARTAGVESEMELAYAGLHQLSTVAPSTNAIVERLDELPTPQRHAIETAFGMSTGDVPDRFLVSLGVLTLLSGSVDERPLLCVIDDAQWLDHGSLQVLAFVARRLMAESVALVFAVREPKESHELAGLPELRIEGLDDVEARALLELVVPAPLDERVRDRIVAETHGNPLALLELPRGLTAAELEFGFGLPDTLPIDNRIEQGFLRQLEPLPVDTRRALLAAAVEPIGDVTVLQHALDRLAIEGDALAAAEAAGLITLGIRVRFRHPLVRSAVCRGADRRELQLVHRALADVIDPEVDPDRRAWHRAYAATGPDEDVAAELERAAERSMRRGGVAAAAALLERAGELTPDPAVRGGRTLAAAHEKLYAADFAGSQGLLAAAELCPLDTLQRARAERLRASLAATRGLAEGCVQLSEAARRLEPLDVGMARGAHLGAVGNRAQVGRLECSKSIRELAEAARTAPPAPRPPRVIDLLLDGYVARYTDGYAASLAPFRDSLRATEAERESADALVEWVWFPAFVAREIWDDDGWDRLTANVVELARQAGALNTLPTALDQRASVEVRKGRFDAASALLDEAETILSATGTPLILHASCELAAWRGREAPALDLIDAVEQLWTAFGVGAAIGTAEGSKAIMYNGLGRYQDAFAAASAATAFDDFGLCGSSLVELVEAAVRTGDHAAATAALPRLAEPALAAGSDWSLGRLARARALRAGGDDADKLHREAIERLERSWVVECCRAHLLYGEWLRREKRPRDAREHLRSAYETFAEIGAEAFAERARRELAATGETVRRRTVESREVLTPQETQIARLAGEGRTNPEIGSQLYISPRTVEYHLSKVFTKLGLSSRRELRTALGSR